LIDNTLGKKAEKKIKEWLNRPEEGYCLDRLEDKMTGFYGSKNICDFTLFKSPYMYYIESKATYEARFDFAMIRGFNDPGDKTCQYGGMFAKSRIHNVFGVIIVLFATYQRAFLIDIVEIEKLRLSGKKSLNITKLNEWDIRYTEIQTVPSRKELLDYKGDWIQ